MRYNIGDRRKGIMRGAVICVAVWVLAETLGARPLAQDISFEVASFKPLMIQSGPDPYSAPAQIRGTTVSVRGDLAGLVLAAYNLKYYQFGGGAPNWASTELYEIIGKSAINNPTLDQSRQMLRALLIERCQLKVHLETKQMPAYNLIVAGSGPKLPPPTPGSAPMRQQVGIHTHLVVPDVTSDDIASMAAGFVEIPVFNKTGLTGHYSLDFQVDRDGSIFSAIQQQLGLRLVSTHESVEVIVIDKILKPEN